MDHRQIVQTLSYGWPDAEWHLEGDDIGALVWHGPGRKPTPAEIADMADEAEANSDAVRAEARARALAADTLRRAQLVDFAKARAEDDTDPRVRDAARVFLETDEDARSA